MSNNFAIKADDFSKIIDEIRKTPQNAERKINSYLHNEGAELITQSVTKYIPVSTGRYAAHRNLQKKYRHKKTEKHARDANWALVKNYNLAVNITNTNKYYYLYFVENGLGTSRRTGGIDFVSEGIDDVYDRIINGLIDSINKEEF